MRVCFLIIALTVVFYTCEAKRKRKFEGDFEFAEEDDSKSNKSGEKKRWIHDPSSDLCRPLNCQKKEICLLEDSFTAVCVSRKELKKNGDTVIPKSVAESEKMKEKDDYDDDDIFYDTDDSLESESSEDLFDATTCKPCPVVKPIFLCGTDNRTYSSLCRLDYHNCIHRSSITVGCKGFCPCTGSDERSKKKLPPTERLNTFMNKYKATLDKTGNGASMTGRRPNRAKSDVVYTPQDLKYENKHYKYIKYTKYNKEMNDILHSEDKERMLGYNEVMDKSDINSNSIYGTPIYPNKECSASALQSMGNRLLDWFSVVMADSSKRRKPKNKSKVRFPQYCKYEVRWMFQHLDMNGDGQLSLQELYDLEHDQNEACLKQFIQKCDLDRDVILISTEWCKCFQKTERPCLAVKRKITADYIGAFVPQCDSQGYYKPVQCHSAVGVCWCVDKHGVEFANTRTRDKPNCDVLLNKPSENSRQISTNSIDDDEGEDDIDQEIEGSADRPEEY